MNSISKSKFRNRLTITMMLAVLASFAAWQYYAYAVTTQVLNQDVQLFSHKVTYSDVTGGTSVDPALYCGDTQSADVSGNSCKKVIIETHKVGAVVVGIANNVTASFAISGMNTTIKVSKIVVEDASGNQLSSSNLAGSFPNDPTPPSLDQVKLWNGESDSPEYGFYDENNSINLVYYIYCRNRDTGAPTSCNSLSAGELHVLDLTVHP